jgi:cellobiose transport system substrate-binding protein
MRATRWRRVRILGAFLLAGVLASCSSGGGDNEGGGSSTTTPENVRLVVNTFGNFGYKELYKQYQQQHPNVTIVENVTEYNQHHQQLATRLAAGSGAGDLVAVDEGFIVQFRSQPQNFANLLDYGAGEIKDRWLPWKWEQSLSPDGQVQIGLGTDVGGMAMCYRTDLFKAAGLPTDRAEVSQLWPDWNAYIETGKRFAAAGTNAKFIDSGTQMYNTILAQAPLAYYDKQNQLITSTNPAVKNAFDTTMQAVQANLSANLITFSPQWNSGFQKSAFATLPCPAWMMGYIQGQAPKTKGKWDVAAVPGGSGNWGGSFLTVPKQSKHPREAYELAAFLTAPEQTLTVFKETGNLPSQPSLYTDPALTDFKNPFFSDAPVGQIFTTAAKNLQPQYQGPKHGQIRQQIERSIQRVEQGKQTPEEAWQQAQEDAEKVAA